MQSKVFAWSVLKLATYGCFLILAAVLLAWASAAVAQDEARVKAGLQVWKNSGCSECHGAFADGDKERDEAPTGANLRQMRLDNAAIAETIQFGEDAYSTRGCYGKPPGPPPDDLYPSSRTLNAQEIDDVVTYLRARIIGRRAVTPEECAYYYEETASTNCDPAK